MHYVDPDEHLRRLRKKFDKLELDARFDDYRISDFATRKRKEMRTAVLAMLLIMFLFLTISIAVFIVGSNSSEVTKQEPTEQVMPQQKSDTKQMNRL